MIIASHCFIFNRCRTSYLNPSCLTNNSSWFATFGAFGFN